MKQVSERHQIARGVFYEINDMISSTKADLEIALDYGNPMKFKRVLKFAIADYDSLVLITRPWHLRRRHARSLESTSIP